MAFIEIVFGVVKWDKRLYTHVAIVDFDTTMKLEMAFPRSHRIEISSDQDYVVGTVQLPSEIRDKAVAWARAREGQAYSWLDMIKGWFGDNNSSQYCSGWALRAYKEGANSPLASGDKMLSPDQMATLPVIKLES